MVICLNIHPFNDPFPGLPRWAGTRKVKPLWILLKQETVSGSGISWAICKSAPRSSQITTPAAHHSVFYRPDALPATQPTESKHWSELLTCICPSWCHCHSLSLASIKSRLVLPFWYQLTWVVPEKGLSNGCVCVLVILVGICWSDCARQWNGLCGADCERPAWEIPGRHIRWIH